MSRSAFGIEHGRWAEVAKTAPVPPGGALRLLARHSRGVGLGLGAAGALAGGAVIDNGFRHARNKKSGTNISLGQMYLHPVRSNKAWASAARPSPPRSP